MFQLLTAYVVKEDVIQHFVIERTKISQSLQSFEKLHILRILLLCKDRWKYFRCVSKKIAKVIGYEYSLSCKSQLIN